MDFGLELGRPEVTLRTRSVTGSVTLIPAALPLSASQDSGTYQVRCLCYWLYWIVICVLVLCHYIDPVDSANVVAEGTYKHNNYTQYKATTNTRLTCRVPRFQELTNWRPLRRGRDQRPSCGSHFREYEFIQGPYGYSLHCRQALNHYLSQFWLRWVRSKSPCGITKPQWVNYHFKVTKINSSSEQVDLLN